MHLITQGYGGLLVVTQGYGPESVGPPVYAANDVISAIQTWWLTNVSMEIPPAEDEVMAALLGWWLDNVTLGDLTSDGKLHHLQAPEGTALPYITYFKVSDVAEVYSTAYGQWRASVQFNVHAETDVEAQSIADQLRQAMRTIPGNAGAQLTIYGSKSWYVLPSAATIQLGEGLGPDGKDCWLAFFVAEIPYIY